MTIRICNRNRAGRERLEQLVTRYKNERGLSTLKIFSYDSPGKLEADLRKEGPGAYLLDLMYPDMSGIELAKRIRMYDSRSPIIFISPPAQEACGASGAYAVRYFVKQEELYEALDHALEPGKGKGSDFYSLNTVEGRQSIRLGEIMYVERIAQAILITTASGKAYESVTIRESFASKVGMLLEDARFTQTHVSFLVNIDAVDRYQKNQMIMRDGRCIPISRKYIPAVKEKYNAYCC